MESVARETLFQQISRTVLAVQQRPELLTAISEYWNRELTAEEEETKSKGEELTREFCEYVSRGWV